MFKGSNVALITPFKDNKLDVEAYIKLIHFHLKNGTNGLVPAGTTGESPTLSHDEHQQVIELCVKESKGSIPVIAGTGSNSTKEAISLTKHAESVGASAALVVTPYYNKPTQEGLYQHYKAINNSCGIPIIIYNIPSRSVIDMNVDTMARLFELKNIIGVKDATGVLDRVSEQKKKMANNNKKSWSAAELKEFKTIIVAKRNKVIEDLEESKKRADDVPQDQEKWRGVTDKIKHFSEKAGRGD